CGRRYEKKSITTSKRNTCRNKDAIGAIKIPKISKTIIRNGVTKMNYNRLVSIITPCYNGEKFVERFFENILDQTYKNIELIFVNDCSYYKTEEIAMSYIPKFEAVGKRLIYIYQKNAGQAAAINKGLPIFKGDYLMWTDSYDLLDRQNVDKKVNYMENHLDVGIVMCRGRKVLETNLNHKIEEY